MDRNGYFAALLRAGWSWLLAALFVAVNTISLLVGIADGSQSIVILLPVLVLIALAGWFVVRAHKLAIARLESGG